MCTYISIYVRPQGAAVWHNHDLKSDQLISCIYAYMSFIRSFFFPPLRNSCDECNLGLYPGYIYQKTPVKSTVAESTIAGRVSAAAERPRTRLPAVFAFLQDSLSRQSLEPRIPHVHVRPRSTRAREKFEFPSVSSIIEIFRHVQR